MLSTEVKKHQYLKSTQNNNIIKNNNFPNEIKGENIFLQTQRS